MKIKSLLLLLIPISIGIEIQAAAKSQTITVTNKTGNSIWISTQNDLKNAIEIKSEKTNNILLKNPGTFAYIANQEIPFKTGSCTTLAITYFNNNNTFYAYAQSFSITNSILGFNGPGTLNPAPYNKIQGTSLYIYNNPYSSVELTATNSNINPFPNPA